MDDNTRAMEKFLLSKKGTSEATQYHYTFWIKIFIKYLNDNKKSIYSLNQDELVKFLGEQYEKYEPKSMNHLKTIVKNFLKYTIPSEWYSKFPNIQEICKGHRVPPKYNASEMLSQEEIQYIIQKENDPFWKLVYAMQFYGGCRPIEISRLKWKDVTIADEGVYFRIYSAKNNRIFEKFVPNEYSFYMKELQKASKSEYCFTKTNNEPITRHTIYIRLERHTKKIGFEKKVTPYLMRHSIATILYGRSEKGELNDDVVARQMGHSKSMKDIYTRFDQKTLREAAKNIYIKPDYTPEEKDEIKILKGEVKQLRKLVISQDDYRERMETEFSKVQDLINQIKLLKKY